MVNCLKDFEEDIVACLCTADPGCLTEDLLKNGLLAQADFNPFGLLAPPKELVRYLLIHVYKQLQALEHGTSAAAVSTGGAAVNSGGASGDAAVGSGGATVGSGSATVSTGGATVSSGSATVGSGSATVSTGGATVSSGSATVSSGGGAALYERCFQVLSKHGVSDEMIGHVRCKYRYTVSSDYLREEHVSILSNILAKYADKWHEIGIALNLPRHFLKELQPKMLLYSAKVPLDSLLCEWVLLKHAHAERPTLSNLKAALASNLVELGDVASTLEPTFLEHDLGREQSCLDAVECRQNQGCRPHSIPQSTPTNTLSLAPEDSIVVECGKVLAEIYLEQPELPEDSWPPVSHGTFINLALIRQSDIKDSDEYACYTIQGDMDDVYKDKDSIEYEGVFIDLNSGARLLIEGRPGSGKTTLVHKVSRDWAKGLLLEGIQLLFLVYLRHFFSDPSITLRDIVKNHYPDDSTADHIVRYAQKHSGKGICFILDGLDEYVPKIPNTTIFKLIQKNILPKALVIVASRPAALAQYRKKATKRIETLGFLKDQIHQYIENYEFSSPDTTRELFSYLALHPNVMHMCYLPIHSSMVCFLYDKMGSALPKTETEMYEKFTCHTLLRALYREEQESDICLESVGDLSSDKKQIFARVCQLAFEKTRSSLQVMKGSDISFSGVINCGKGSLGLITVDRTAKMYGMESLYTFLHLTFQEYLAAYHVAHLTEGEQLKLIISYGEKENMRVVWKFFCGIVKFNNPPIKFTQLLRYADDDLFKIQCAFESQQPGTCDSVVESGNGNQLSFCKKFLNPTDFIAVGYVLKNLTCPIAVELVLKECNFGHEGVDTLVKEAGDKLHLIKTVRYHGGACSKEQFRNFIALLQHIPHLQTLDMTDTTIGAAKTNLLTHVLTHDQMLTLPDLKVFELSSSQYNSRILKMLRFVCGPGNKFQGIIFNPPVPVPISDEDQLEICCKLGLPVLVYSIRQFPCVNLRGHQLGCSEMLKLSGDLSKCTQLILSGCKLGDEEANILGHALKSAPKLQKLNMAFNYISNSGAKYIAEGLPHCSDLGYLNLSCNEFGDTGAIAIAEKVSGLVNCRFFMWNHKITKEGKKILSRQVGTTECTAIPIENDDISLFISHLTSSSGSYRELKLRQMKQCTTSEIFRLFRSLSSFKCLQTLDLSLNKITASRAKVLAESIKYYSSLHTLHLDENCIGCNGAMAIFEGLKCCKSLQSLHLGGNNIGIYGACAIGEGLKYLWRLRTLHLGGNKIGTEGAKALSVGLKHCYNLQTLDLGENEIGTDGAVALSEGLKFCKRLKSLHLGMNKIGTEGAKALSVGLKHCYSLQTLHLNGNDIGTDGAVAVGDGLKDCNALQTLILKWNRINFEGIHALAQNLKHCSSLCTLDLSWNEVGADGAKILAEGLKQCECLNLSWNRIGSVSEGALDLPNLHFDGNGNSPDGAIKCFANYLGHWDDLTGLNLTSISADGTKVITEFINCNPNLQSLKLAFNDDCKVIYLLRSLKCCKCLSILDLKLNDIGVDGAAAIAECLKHCSCLHALCLNGKMGTDGVKALARGLTHCKNLQALQLVNSLYVSPLTWDDTWDETIGVALINRLHTRSIIVNCGLELAAGLEFCKSMETLQFCGIKFVLREGLLLKN